MKLPTSMSCNVNSKICGAGHSSEHPARHWDFCANSATCTILLVVPGTRAWAISLHEPEKHSKFACRFVAHADVLHCLLPMHNVMHQQALPEESGAVRVDTAVFTVWGVALCHWGPVVIGEREGPASTCHPATSTNRRCSSGWFLRLTPVSHCLFDCRPMDFRTPSSEWKAETLICDAISRCVSWKMCVLHRAHLDDRWRLLNP